MVPAAASREEAPVKPTTESPVAASGKGAAKAGKAAAAPQLSLELSTEPTAQNEFPFNEVESRGYFDKTDRNLFEGQDLDVPTYLRKGVKIML